MASRKTYFGIGLPKDLIDPGSGPVAQPGADPEDRSAPTVVDDEKVAEGLKQLRSWYRSEDKTDEDKTAKVPIEPRPAMPLGSYARPTAVGHATAPPAASVSPPPMAPDPMRATMFGHDVHRFDPTSPDEVPQLHEPSTALAPASVPYSVPPSAAPPTHRPAPGPPDPEDLSPADAFHPARLGEAVRLQRPPGIRRSSYSVPPRPPRRLWTASAVMFGVGTLALAGALVLWSQTEGGGEPAPAPAPRTPISVPPAPAPNPPPAAVGQQPSVPATAPATPIMRAPQESQPAAPLTPVAARPPERALPEPRTNREVPSHRQRVPKKVDVVAPPEAIQPSTEPTEATPSTEATEKPSDATSEKNRELLMGEPVRTELPVRKKPAGAKAGDLPRRRTRIGSDSDETLPPSDN